MRTQERPRGQQVWAGVLELGFPWSSSWGPAWDTSAYSACPSLGSLSPESTTRASVLPGGLEEAGPSWLQGDWTRVTRSAGSRLFPDSGWGGAQGTCLPYRAGMSRRRRWSGVRAWRGCRCRPFSRWCRWPHSGPRCSSPSHPSCGRWRPQNGRASVVELQTQAREQERQAVQSGRGQEPRAPRRKEAVCCSPFASWRTARHPWCRRW